MPALEFAQVQLAREHGKIIDLANGVKLIAMYHPNYIMLKPSAKRDAWDALQDAQKMLKIA